MEYFPPCSSYLWDIWGSKAPRGSIVERFVTVHVREEGIVDSGISVVPIGATKSALGEHYPSNRVLSFFASPLLISFIWQISDSLPFRVSWAVDVGIFVTDIGSPYPLSAGSSFTATFFVVSLVREFILLFLF